MDEKLEAKDAKNSYFNKLYHSGKISVLLAKKNLSGFSDRKQVHIAIWAYFRSLNRADFSKPKVHLFFRNGIICDMKTPIGKIRFYNLQAFAKLTDLENFLVQDP